MRYQEEEEGTIETGRGTRAMVGLWMGWMLRTRDKPYIGTYVFLNLQWVPLGRFKLRESPGVPPLDGSGEGGCCGDGGPPGPR